MDTSLKRTIEEYLTLEIGNATSILAVDRIGGGSIHSAAEVKTNTGSFFVKWNRTPARMFELEALGLRELKSVQSSLIIPQVIGYKEQKEGHSFLILEFLQSTTPDNNDEETLGRGLAEIHQKSSLQFGFFENNYCGSTPQKNDFKSSWAEFYLENRLQFLLNLLKESKIFSSADLKTFQLFLKHLPDKLGDPEPPSLIHGDLWSGNRLYTNRGPALIDPAVYYGHREAELGMMFLFGGFSPRVIEAYTEYFPLQRGWQERLELYKLYHILNHALLFGGSYAAQALDIARQNT